jgi:type IV secretory pathway VirB9-like protein
MKVFVKLIVLLIFLINGKVYAENRSITSMAFNPQEITTKKGMITTIQFSSIINYFVIGDELIADAENINSNTILISPKLAGESTNLNVKTKDGNYVFIIKTLEYNSKEEPILHINVGKLANVSLNSLEKEIKKQESKEKHNPAFDYKFNMYSKWFCGFWFCDYKKIAPNKVWTDGQYTYLDYSTTDGTIRNIPTIQEVADGIDIPVNKVIKGNVIVVHTLAKKITIVANGAFVCIEYNGDAYEVR